MAPEVIESDCGYDESIDAWSLGVLLYNMITGEMPFTGTTKSIQSKTLHKNPCYKQKAWK